MKESRDKNSSRCNATSGFVGYNRTAPDSFSKDDEAGITMSTSLSVFSCRSAFVQHMHTHTHILTHSLSVCMCESLHSQSFSILLSLVLLNSCSFTVSLTLCCFIYLCLSVSACLLSTLCICNHIVFSVF